MSTGSADDHGGRRLKKCDHDSCRSRGSSQSQKLPPNKSAKVGYSCDVVTGWKGSLEEEMIESYLLIGGQWPWLGAEVT